MPVIGGERRAKLLKWFTSDATTAAGLCHILQRTSDCAAMRYDIMSLPSSTVGKRQRENLLE